MFGRQKTKWVVRNFWGLQKQLPWGQKITSEEFTSGQRFCFQMFPNGYCMDLQDALKSQTDAATNMSVSSEKTPDDVKKPILELCVATPYFPCHSPQPAFSRQFSEPKLNPALSRCKKVNESITPGTDPKNVETFGKLTDNSGGLFSTSSGYLSLFLHYGEDPISRNTVSKAVFQLGIVLQKKDPSGFFCPKSDLEPGGVCVQCTSTMQLACVTRV